MRLKVLHRRAFQALLISILVVSFQSFSTVNAFAASRGGDGSGGGVIFACKSRIYLADSYSYFSSLSIEARQRLSVISTDQATELANNVVFGLDQPMAAELNLALKTIRLVPSDTLLQALGDDDIGSPPLGCSKRQLAVQTLKTGVVGYVSVYYWSLTPIERALFKYHEAYVHVYGSNSTAVRNKIARVSWNQIFRATIQKLMEIPTNGICDSAAQLLPPILIGCKLFSTEVPSIRAQQATALMCENQNPWMASDDRSRAMCTAVVSEYAKLGWIDVRDVISGTMSLKTPVIEVGWDQVNVLRWKSIQYRLLQLGYRMTSDEATKFVIGNQHSKQSVLDFVLRTESSFNK